MTDEYAATESVRTRRRTIERQVERIVDECVDGPLSDATRRTIADVSPGVAPVVAHLCAEIAGAARSDDDVLAVATAMGFVDLHVRVHARLVVDGDGDGEEILVGDLLRSLADRTVFRSSLDGRALALACRACATASRASVEAVQRTRRLDAIDSSAVVPASRAGAVVGDGGEWLPAYVGSLSDDGSDGRSSSVPVDAVGPRLETLGRFLAENGI